MKLVNLQNIATTKQGQQVNLVLNELYIGSTQQSITTPWQLEIVDGEGNVIRTVTATGMDTGDDYVAWRNSQAGQMISDLLTHQAQQLLLHNESNIRRQLDFFADLNS